MFPERLEAKAILLPSGEYLGESSDRVEAISFVGGLFFKEEFGPGARQMFSSCLL